MCYSLLLAPLSLVSKCSAGFTVLALRWNPLPLRDCRWTGMDLYLCPPTISEEKRKRKVKFRRWAKFPV